MSHRKLSALAGASLVALSLTAHAKEPITVEYVEQISEMCGNITASAVELYRHREMYTRRDAEKRAIEGIPEHLHRFPKLVVLIAYNIPEGDVLPAAAIHGFQDCLDAFLLTLE